MKLNDRHLSYYARHHLDSPDKDGWLYKKGELNTSYQKRWCVLKNNLFFYFEKKLSSKSDQEAIGVIILENSSVQLAECKDSQFTFSIHFPGDGTRIYKFTAENEQYCNEWIRALTVCTYRYWHVLSEDLEKKLGENRVGISNIVDNCFRIRSDNSQSTNCSTISSTDATTEATLSTHQTSIQPPGKKIFHKTMQKLSPATIKKKYKTIKEVDSIIDNFQLSSDQLPSSNCVMIPNNFLGMHNQYWNEINDFISSVSPES